MNSTVSNKKFTTDFNRGSIKSKVIGGVGSLGRVIWEVVPIALQQPLKTSLEMSCCACWGWVLVHCAVCKLCAFWSPPHIPDRGSYSAFPFTWQHSSLQTLLYLCPSECLASQQQTQPTWIWDTQCDINLKKKIVLLSECELVISSTLIVRIIENREVYQAARMHQILLKNWNVDRVYLERGKFNCLQWYRMGTGGFLVLFPEGK